MINKPKLSIIVAMAQNNVIGVENDLPWHIPEDLKRFKAVTSGKPVIMGRKTFDSIYYRIKKPLPGRESIVISRSQNYDFENVHMANSVEDAIDQAYKIAQKQGIGEIFCIGGAQIYKQVINHCDRIYLTFIHNILNGDAYFPEFDESLYDLIEDQKSSQTQEDGEVLEYSFRVYERKKS